MARIAATTAGMSTLDTTPFQITPCAPTAAIVAPTMPPISACEELEGIPSSQVSRFQTMPPTRPANTSSSVTMCRIDQTLGDRGRDGGGQERAHQIEHRGQCDRRLGRERAAGDGGRHRVAGVVEAVGEIESQCRDYDNDQEEQLDVHSA